MLDLSLIIGFATAIASFIICLFSGFDPDNLFSSAPGEWTEIPEVLTIIFPMMTVPMFLVLMWGRTNLPELGDATTVYLIIFLAISVVFVGELLDPGRYPLATISAFGSGGIPGVLFELVIGAAIAFIFTYFPLASLTPVQLTAPASPIGSLFYSLFFTLIPPMEEMAFSGISLPSMTERSGIVTSLLLNAIFFGLFHYAIYGADPTLMLRAALFRFSVDCFTLQRRSLLPAFTAHLLLNISSL